MHAQRENYYEMQRVAMCALTRAWRTTYNQRCAGVTGRYTCNVLGEEVSTRILAVNEFSSKRKRMSVVAEDAAGRKVLYVKGADNVMLPRLRKDAATADLHAKLQQHLNICSEAALRTLVLARRVLTAAEWAEWSAAYDAASTTLEDREVFTPPHCLSCATSTRPAERARRLGHFVFRSMLRLPCAHVQGDD